jgi:hypothetical protein
MIGRIRWRGQLTKFARSRAAASFFRMLPGRAASERRGLNCAGGPQIGTMREHGETYPEGISQLSMAAP